jgi:hypothetical protein
MTSHEWRIEPPSPFAPKAEWEAHLENLRQLAGPNDSADLQTAIAEVEDILEGRFDAEEPASFPDPKSVARKIV